jgi:hypothetical protein
MDGKITRRIREKQSHVLFVLFIIGDTVRLLYLGVDITLGGFIKDGYRSWVQYKSGPEEEPPV